MPSGACGAGCGNAPSQSETGLSRRHFLQEMGVAGMAAGILALAEDKSWAAAKSVC